MSGAQSVLGVVMTLLASRGETSLRYQRRTASSLLVTLGF